jgi:gamma-glutamyl hercynylcysteine S-oxide synthase
VNPLTVTKRPPAASFENESALKAAISARLETVRQRTLELIEGLSEDALNRVHDPLMSPIVWDLGHMATFEDLWLVQRPFGEPPLRRGLDGVYDPFAAPRSARGDLPYLRSSECFGYMKEVRERVLACLEMADLSSDGERLLADGFVYEMLLRHEQQHSETILQTLQMMTAEAYTPRRVIETPVATKPGPEMVLVPGGSFRMGAEETGFAYDNERPRHARELASFLIDAAPVTNGEMVAFIGAGGYERREWWSPEGWAWREREQISLPAYWRREREDFAVRSFAEWEAVDPARPVCHVSWFEADAFARSIGKRLPSEAEWELAASWDHATGEKRPYPWGDEAPSHERANLDQLAFGTAPAGAYEQGASPCGALQLIGDVWEWTASGFEQYPGFEAFPYREYSEEFFGGPYKVLRGGSWATQPDAVTTTFRNWDFPQRRQIFAGFRCAKDVG